LKFNVKVDRRDRDTNDGQFVGTRRGAIVMLVKCGVRVSSAVHVIDREAATVLDIVFFDDLPVQRKVQAVVIGHAFLVTAGVVGIDQPLVAVPGIGAGKGPAGSISKVS